MKLIDLLELRRVFTPHTEDCIPAVLAYKLCRMAKRADEEQKLYVQSLNAIIQKYGERDEDGNLITKDGTVKMDENQKELWQKELSDLQNLQVDFSITFTVDELSHFHFSISDMQTLSNYIVEDK